MSHKTKYIKHQEKESYLNPSSTVLFFENTKWTVNQQKDQKVVK